MSLELCPKYLSPLRNHILNLPMFITTGDYCQMTTVYGSHIILYCWLYKTRQVYSKQVAFNDWHVREFHLYFYVLVKREYYERVSKISEESCQVFFFNHLENKQICSGLV